jgi:hypothetical protein
MILCGDSLSVVISRDGCKGVEAVLRTHSYEHMRHSRKTVLGHKGCCARTIDESSCTECSGGRTDDETEEDSRLQTLHM